MKLSQVTLAHIAGWEIALYQFQAQLFAAESRNTVQTGRA